MRVRKRIAAVAMAAVMAFSTVAVPNMANAEVAYQKNDVVIDTSAVPHTDNEDITVLEEGKKISAKANVCFTLDADVDVRWSVTGYPYAGAEDEDSILSVDKYSGKVKIPADAVSGQYTITASANNGSSDYQYNSASIVIKVENKNAVATRVVLDKEAIEEQAENVEVVTGDGKGTQEINCEGAVDDLTLYADVEPAYLNDQTYSFDVENTKAISISNDMQLTTSGVTKGDEIGAYVSGQKDSVEKIRVNVKERAFSFKLVSDQVAIDRQACTFYNNHTARLEVEENSDIALTENAGRIQVNSIETDLVQTAGTESKTLKKTPVVEDGEIVAYDYEVYGTKIGDDNVQSSKVAAVIRVSEDSREVWVTTAEEEITSCDPVDITFKYYYNTNLHSEVTYRFTFQGKNMKNVGGVSLKFDEEDMGDVPYCVKEENVGNETADVYYFEKSGLASDEKMILDLTKMTYSDQKGNSAFEEAKEHNFNDENLKYTISYTLSSLDSVEKSYQADIADSAWNLTGTGVIKDPTQFEFAGTGYFKLTLECKGPAGTTVEGKSYIFRVVSSAKDVENLSIMSSSRENETYNLASDEVVHIRTGEAFTLSIGDTPVTLADPYLECAFSEDGVANILRDKKGRLYVSGLKQGKILVTVMGAADPTKEMSFWLYVNADQYTSAAANDYMEIDFRDAIAEGKVKMAEGKYAIQGKFDKIPLKLIIGESASGIPQVAWSLETKDGAEVKDDYATIDAQGNLTTKRSGNDVIVVVAKKVASDGTIGEEIASAEVVVADVEATGISEISEKVPEGQSPKVTSTSVNNGKVNMGESFQLYASKYIPANATSINGKTVQWTSKDPDIATVDAEGNVKAVSVGTTDIIATYSNSGLSSSKYTLTVEKSDVKVTGIDATDLILTRIDDKATINAKVLPDNATNKKLTYVSENEKIVQVNSTGQVTAMGVGTTTITITSVSNPDVKKVINVEVQGKSDNPVTTGTPKPSNPAAGQTSTPNPSTAPSQSPVPSSTPQVSVGPAATAAPAGGNTVTTPKAAKVAKSAVKSAKNVKGKKIKLKLKKVPGAKYEISYGLKKNFKGAKKVKTANVSYTIKKLKKGKKYFIRVRAFKKVNGKTVYSGYSAVKSVKVKK